MKNVPVMIMTFGVAMLAVPAMAADGGDAFKTGLSLGVTLTDGNSETLQANGSLVTEGKKDGFGSVRAGVEANYGENTTDAADGAGSSTDTTVENARAFAGVKKNITKRTFGSVDASAQYDDIARIDHRTTLGPGLGLYLVENESTTLSAEVGPSYIWEKVDDVSDDYLAARVGERLEHALSETARLWQSAEYLPKADDFGDYLLNAEIGVEAALNSRLNLRLVLQNKHDSTPGEGLEKDDTVLIGGVSLTL